MPNRKGQWMHTISGHRVHPYDPQPTDIDIRDIAHALSLICRFNGHVTYFYSVAQHSLAVSRLLERQGHLPTVALYGLLHDAAEAYICDLPSPVKKENDDSLSRTLSTAYATLERRLLDAICHKFKLHLLPWPAEITKAVAYADKCILVAEARDLQGTPEWARELSTSLHLEVPDDFVRRRVPHFVREQFLEQFHKLLNDEVPTYE